MREQLMQKHSELREIMKKHDEALAKMINVKTRDTIRKIITEFLSQHES